MILFLGDIAGMLEIFAIGFGFVLLHKARSESNPGLLKTGAWVLLAGGVIVGLCTIYYFFEYKSQGALDTAMPMHSTQLDGGATMGSGSHTH